MSTDLPTSDRTRTAIARGVASLLHDQLGHGPAAVRTTLADDLVLVVFGDVLTKSEQLLAETDNETVVRDLRRTLMDTLNRQIREIVEKEVGRKVVTQLGDHSVLPDLGFTACLLEPVAGGGRAQGFSLPPDRDKQRQITRGMSQLYKRFVGRGANGSRTYIDGDVVAVLLAETLTQAEQTLAADDRESRVREMRREFQEAIKRDAGAIVAEAVGRPVRAFMSDHSIFPDIALEVFLLEPGG